MAALYKKIGPGGSYCRKFKLVLVFLGGEWWISDQRRILNAIFLNYFATALLKKAMDFETLTNCLHHFFLLSLIFPILWALYIPLLLNQLRKYLFNPLRKY